MDNKITLPMRPCAMCGHLFPPWEFGTLFSPRAPDTSGWLKKQCPSCYEKGGRPLELEWMREEVLKLKTRRKADDSRIKELISIIRAMEGASRYDAGEDE